MPYPGSLPPGQFFNGQQPQYPASNGYGQGQNPQHAYAPHTEPFPHLPPPPHQPVQPANPPLQPQQQQARPVQYPQAPSSAPASAMNFASSSANMTSIPPADLGHFDTPPSFTDSGAFDSRHFNPTVASSPSHSSALVPSPAPSSAPVPAQYMRGSFPIQQLNHSTAPGVYPGYHQHMSLQQGAPQYYAHPQYSATVGHGQSVPVLNRPSYPQQQRMIPPSPQPGPHGTDTGSPRPQNSPAVPPSTAVRTHAQAIGGSPGTRSPSLPKRSPAIPPRHSPATSSRSSSSLPAKPPTFDTPVVLVKIAEECFHKAYMSADAAPSTTEAQVWEHQKLISTGLACLEAAVHSNKLPPRQEAKARLRYASILYEETENLQEAETTLFQGIKLCEKHRYTDLRYCLQFMSLKVLFQRNQKAAFIALDKQIAECQTFKHIPWVYAFRLLKATLQTYAGNSVEIALLDNLQSLSTLAHERGDHAVGVLGSLLEGLAHLRVTKQDTVERVQTCLAQVAKYQLDPFVQVLQLDVLTLLLDLACSMHQKNPDLLVHKLSALQSRMDAGLDSKEWADGVAEMRIPLKKQHSSYHLISDDTGAILQAGSLDEGRDFVVMSFLTRAELFALVYTFSGLASLYRFHHNPAKVQRKSSELWEEGLKVIQQLASVSEAGAVTATVSRHESIRQAKWRTEMFCYLQLLTGLYCATQSRWSVVDQCLVKLQKAATQTPNDIFSLCCLYLTGVYHQGTGDLETALLLFQDSRFDIDSTLSAGGGRKPALLELCLLAALNRLWILQAPDFRDDTTTLALLEKVRPICTEHHDPEIRTAFHLVQATTRTNQPVSMQVIKTSIHSAVQTSKQIGNTHCLAIGLSIMRYQLFDNVVGEQALKSAKAASAQSKRSGNLLWMSVADGMLAHSYEVQEQMAEAQAAQKAASEYAARALIGKN